MTTKAARSLQYVPVDEIPDAPTNAKDHARTLIDSSITRFRFIEPLVIDERTGRLIAGHGRRDSLQRMQRAGLTPPEGIQVRKDGTWMAPVSRGWASVDDDDAEAAGIALNRVGEAGGWLDDQLHDSLTRLAALPDGLAALGFTKADLTRLAPSNSSGSLLALADVSVAEPTHVVERGDIWNISHHVLVCADVMTQHDLWAPLLAPGALFIPYPGPYVALSDRADQTPFVMVQPDTYVAGHVLDKFAAVRGKKSVSKR